METAVQAAQALKPIAGPYAALLFTVGIIGTGLLSVPVLAGSASYAVSEAFGWKLGLYKHFKNAKAFYAVIAVATLVGFTTNFIGIAPFKMLYYTAILNGLCAPPLMVIIILIGNNRAIMGEHVNSAWSAGIAWMITALMAIAAVALLLSLGQPQ